MGIYCRSLRSRRKARAVSRRWGERIITVKHKIHRNRHSVTYFLDQYQNICHKSGITPKYTNMEEWMYQRKSEDEIPRQRSDDSIDQQMDCIDPFANERNFQKLLEFVRRAVVSDIDVDIDQVRNAVSYMQSWKRSIYRDIDSKTSK